MLDSFSPRHPENSTHRPVEFMDTIFQLTVIKTNTEKMSRQLSYAESRTADEIADAVMIQIIEPRTDFEFGKLVSDIHKIAPKAVEDLLKNGAKLAHGIDVAHKGMVAKLKQSQRS
jgi:hypothetical protein